MTVVPTKATVEENATKQFTASLPSTWKTTCGSISSSGLFKAPLYPSTTCVVTATAKDGSGSAKASVTLVSPIIMTPVSATTPLGSTQQFKASAPVTWSAKCGSVTAGGLFTATAAIGTPCTVEGIATGSPRYTVYGFDIVSVPSAFVISPQSPTVSEGGTQQFTASSSATFATSCGTISATGLFTAPLIATSCTITAKSKSGTLASTVATVTSPIVITPASAATASGLTQPFSANAAVIWAASCGSINAAGLYTASAAQGSMCRIIATAATGAAYTASVVDTIAAAPALKISPASATLSESSTQQFTSSVSATWAASCGSIGSTTGLYTAPLTAGACTVTATPIYGTGTASAAVTVTSPLAITPSSAITAGGQTQQFTANLAATWASSCGGMNASSGLFTASGAQGTVCTITATATGSPAYSATALDTIGAAGALTIAPLQPSIAENSTQQFGASAPATWAAGCGIIDPNAGLYTASLSPGLCTVTANATDGSGRTASTSVTVTSPITLTPATVNLHALNTQTFTASQAVMWVSLCGSISSAGVFTAPATANTCTVTATAATGTAFTATATANVDVVNYTAWKGGGGNTGAQADELVLNASTVNANSFGIVWTANVDGWTNAQPLYMNGLTVNGAPHNVVFVETANDSVYAFDGDTGSQLWQACLIPQGATAVSATSVGFTSAPLIGILSTPVIDPTTNTMYVVSETSEQSATYFPHRLHALDITTGNEKFGGPVLISDPNLQPVHKLQRPALTLANGNVYIAFGSMQDEAPYHGLLFAFSTQTLQQQEVLNVTTTGSEGGIWMGGAAPAVDENGDLYLATGNGTFDGTANYGEAALKLSPQLQILDYFAPYNFATYDASDIDLGSGDVMVVPDQTGAYPHELISCGKPTPIYVLDRDNLGHLGDGTDNIIQRLDNVVGQLGKGASWVEACFTAPAMWKQNVYFGGKYDVLKMFTLDPNSGLLSSTPTSQDTLVYGYPGADPVVSANGETDGIVWDIDTGNNTLRANNAANVATLLYSGALPTISIRWTVPMVANGHVYVGEEGTVVGFGLLGTTQNTKQAAVQMGK